MTHRCCPTCRLRLSPAFAAEACPRCFGALASAPAEQLVGYSVWAPTDVPPGLLTAVSQTLVPPSRP
jgi:hypothetical protein